MFGWKSRYNAWKKNKSLILFFFISPTHYQSMFPKPLINSKKRRTILIPTWSDPRFLQQQIQVRPIPFSFRVFFDNFSIEWKEKKRKLLIVAGAVSFFLIPRKGKEGRTGWKKRESQFKIYFFWFCSTSSTALLWPLVIFSSHYPLWIALPTFHLKVNSYVLHIICFMMFEFKWIKV